MEPTITPLDPIPSPLPTADASYEVTPLPERPSPLAQMLPHNRRLDVGGIVATVASVGVALLADPAGLESSIRRVLTAGSPAERVLAGIGLAGIVYAAATRAKR
ncbi:MAG: hypothetical protein IAE99_08225 [Rhodothermales bacterium]|nr:hypothetical protein [Rhodothermales bacterium]